MFEEHQVQSYLEAMRRHDLEFDMRQCVREKEKDERRRKWENILKRLREEKERKPKKIGSLRIFDLTLGFLVISFVLIAFIWGKPL